MFFHIFSEGKNTEPDYFLALGKIIDSSRVKIKCYGPNGVPKSVAEAAINFARKNGLIKGRRSGKINSFEERDEVWAVFDRDLHPSYGDAKQMCSGAKISVGYSDPCFELWLNLHFEDSDAPCTHHQAIDRTKKLLVGYDPDSGKTADFSLLINDVERAEARAERLVLNRIAEANPSGNPSTSIFELTKKIREEDRKLADIAKKG